MPKAASLRDSAATKTRLLDAARDVIRAKGYTAATVDEICAAAGVTKGSFFHHFQSKEQLVIAAVDQFGLMASAIFAAAPYHAHPDPVDRILGYVDFRASMLEWEIGQFTCLLGTTVQEVYATHPEIRAACDKGMSEHVDELVRDIEAAKQVYAPDAPWTPQSVGYFMQAVLQGSFIFAKAKQNSEVAAANLAHLRRYLEMLFHRSQSGKEQVEN
jgi:TetR/AcrR family transcriptional repressor of nem operon